MNRLLSFLGKTGKTLMLLLIVIVCCVILIYPFKALFLLVPFSFVMGCLSILYVCAIVGLSYALNVDKKYRFKQYNNLRVFMEIILFGTVIGFLISSNQIHFLNNNFYPYSVLIMITFIYIIFKAGYKIRLDFKIKNNDSSIDDKYLKHYYKIDDNFYIYEKYLQLSKIFMLMVKVLIFVLGILIFIIFRGNNVFEDIAYVILSGGILILFLSELAFYFDGIVDNNVSVIKKNKKESNKKYTIDDINLEEHRLFGEQLLGSYGIINNYSVEVIDKKINDLDKHDLMIEIATSNEFNKFLYSRVFYPIISGEDIIIEGCLLDNFSEIIVPIVNIMFSASKKILFVCDSIDTVKKCEKWFEELDIKANTGNSNIVVEVMDYENNNSLKTDNNIDIYVGTIDLVLNSKSVYESIDVVVGVNIDKIICENALNLNILASVFANSKNNYVQYVLFGNRVNGLKQIISQVLIRNDFRYQVVKRTNKKKMITNFFVTERGWLQTRLLPNFATQYLGQLIPLAIPCFKYNIKNVDIVSLDQPYDEQVVSLQTAQSLLDNYIEKDIVNINEGVKFFENENFVKIDDKSVMIVADDMNNVALLVSNWLKYANKDLLLNVVSHTYLLRDYIVSNIDFFIGNVEIVGNILPIPKSNIKLAVYKLINQLCYGYVSEDILLSEVKKYIIDKEKEVNEDNLLRFITDSLQELTKQAFGIDIVYSTYLILKKVNVDGVMNNKRYYKLLDSIKKELPDELFKSIYFVDSEKMSKIIKRIPVFELYQNYLDGQYITLNGKYYLIDKIDYENGVVELVNSSYNSSVRYRQRKQITNIIHKENVKEMPVLKVRDSLFNKKIISADIEVSTDGYYEFNDSISFVSGEYSYKKVDSNKKGICRKYKSTNVLVINISNKSILEMSDKERFKISFTLCLLLNEMFETLFSNIKQYILVRSAVSEKKIYTDYLTDELLKLYMPIIDQEVSDGINIYITEDTELEKGIVDAIVNNFDNIIIKLLYDYLHWLIREDDLKFNWNDRMINNGDYIEINEIDKLSFLKYGKNKLSKCLDLEGLFSCLEELIIRGNDNFTISRINYIKNRYNVLSNELNDMEIDKSKNNLTAEKKNVMNNSSDFE